MTLVPRDLEQLSGLIEELSMAEVEQIYLPMSRLLEPARRAAPGAARRHQPLPRPQGRPRALHPRHRRLGGRRQEHHRARAASACWRAGRTIRASTSSPPTASCYPNARAGAARAHGPQGFPESFDTARLLNFLHDVKSGKANVEAPVYSHFHYDIIPARRPSSIAPTS